jgi:integrase
MTTTKGPARKPGRVKITKAWLDELQATGRRETYSDATVDHLVLRVGPDGQSRVWYLSYRNRDGARRLHRIGSLKLFDPESAKVEARKINGLLAKGRDPAGEKAQAKAEAEAARHRTLRGYLEGYYWTHTLSRRRSGKATKERILAAWKPFLDLDLAALGTKQLNEHWTTRIESGKKPQTLNRDRVALLALINQAIKDKVLSSNPIADFGRLKEIDDKRVRYLGQRDKDEDIRDEAGRKIGERERFMVALVRQPLYLRVIAELAMLAGLRRGEIFGLTWHDTDLERREITVRAHTSKGEKPRVVPIPDRTRDLLRGWRAVRLEGCQSEDEKAAVLSGLVVPNPQTGKAFTTVKKAWASLVAEARVLDFHLHDGRHDFASRLAMEGVALITIKELLGHSTIKLTERYAHLADNALRRAVDLLS